MVGLWSIYKIILSFNLCFHRWLDIMRSLCHYEENTLNDLENQSKIPNKTAINRGAVIRSRMALVEYLSDLGIKAFMSEIRVKPTPLKTSIFLTMSYEGQEYQCSIDYQTNKISTIKEASCEEEKFELAGEADVNS